MYHTYTWFTNRFAWWPRISLTTISCKYNRVSEGYYGWRDFTTHIQRRQMSKETHRYCNKIAMQKDRAPQMTKWKGNHYNLLTEIILKWIIFVLTMTTS